MSSETTDEKTNINAGLEQTESTAKDTEIKKVGILTMLNMTEEEMTKFREAGRYIGRIMNEEGYFERNSQQLKGAKDATYYDTLDSMLMALNSGDIISKAYPYRD